MVVGGGELADTHTNYCGPVLIESLHVTKPAQTKKLSLQIQIIFSFFKWSPVCNASLCPWEQAWRCVSVGLSSNTEFFQWCQSALQFHLKLPKVQSASNIQTTHPQGIKANSWDDLTQGVNARLAGNRSELWGSARSWGIGLLRHGGPWLHTWSTGLLPLKEQQVKSVIKQR